MPSLSKSNQRLSFWAVVLLFAALLVVRVGSITANELSWDVFGYYLYLPATFIHHDPLLTDITWVKEAQQQYQATGTLYQLSTAPDGSPVYFFLMGAAVLYSPFFLLAHGLALLTGQPADGFSQVYQTAICLGCLVYTLIGLMTLRKILLHFFSDGIAAAVVLLIGAGTNYFHLNSFKTPETSNLLFCCLSLLVWNTIRWHESGGQRRHILAAAACAGLMALIKPSEITFAVIPLLWGVQDGASLKAKLNLLWRKRVDLLLAALIGLLILSPQFLFWKLATGKFVYDSYLNPGVGLDWWSPHVGPVLFSFRGGWLLYTPIMAFALAGFIFLWKKGRSMFWAISVAFLASFFFVASWTEWWHGESFSNRPIATNYVLLSIPLGYLLAQVAAAGSGLRYATSTLLVALVGLNLFQIWQHQHFVLQHSRMTGAYYAAVFGRTEVPEGAKDLLLVERCFDGLERLEHEDRYEERPLGKVEMERVTEAYADHLVTDSTGGKRLELNEAFPYSPSVERAYSEVTSKDHFWARAEVRMFIPPDHKGDNPCLVMTMERPEGPYGYKAFCVADSVPRGTWFTLKGEYLSPEIREDHDVFKTYVWYRGEGPVLMEDLNVDVLVPR